MALILGATLAFMLGASWLGTRLLSGGDLSGNERGALPAGTSYAALETGKSALYSLEEGRLLVNINAADELTLMLLPGIGETLAERIVQERTQNGAFSSIDDLLRVSGIGPSKLEALRGEICCLPE